MSECEGSKTLGKEGETVSCSIFLDSVTRGYELRLRTSREEDEMTISNTLTVRSGQFLTAPSIRWSRLYMTAHSYAVTFHSYAVTFHCILINTWLNQARTTLLITQDKKTRQTWWPRRDPEEKFLTRKTGDPEGWGCSDRFSTYSQRCQTRG